MRASGQVINLQKSKVYYSRNTPLSICEAINNIIGVTECMGTGKYLGLPSMIGRKKKAIFNNIKDRIWRKINHWSGKYLSKAGNACHGIHWLNWEKVSMRKEHGGMGFRHLHSFNLAMLGKQGWKFLTNQDAILTRIFKAKYFPRGDFLGAYIHASQAVVKGGLRWCIGTWNHELLSSLFSPSDVSAITAIPLTHLHERDSITWNLSRKVGFLKGNVDVAIFKEDNKVGFGICLRDANGSLIKAKSGWFYGVAPSHEAEATTLLESIRWVCDQGYTHVILESDSKQVVEDILNSNIYYSEYGHTLHRCRSLLNSHPNLLVRFIRRQANHVAHSLARASRHYASSHVFDFIPTCIAPLILNDIS
uniref:RNase H type-1 domain-containing protein n=1 Tax=Cajanus cajan TaxID=3821 RepID=A0A151SGZ3_CAJCA|nr:hypothetical protein KK1_000181 [Cajanus cajan]